MVSTAFDYPSCLLDLPRRWLLLALLGFSLQRYVAGGRLGVVVPVAAAQRCCGQTSPEKKTTARVEA